ncbi:MAG: hypothetical protein ABR569_04345 [Gaiellaceae bacterium]
MAEQTGEGEEPDGYDANVGADTRVGLGRAVGPRDREAASGGG